MKHSSKKILTLLLALALFVGMMPLGVFAAASASFYHGYEVDGKEYVTHGYYENGHISPPDVTNSPPAQKGAEFVGWAWKGEIQNFDSAEYLGGAFEFHAVWIYPEDKDNWVTITFESGFEGVEAPPAIKVRKAEEGQDHAGKARVQKPVNYFPKHPGFRSTADANWFKKEDLLAIKSDFNYETDWELVEDLEGEYRIFNHYVDKDTTYVLKWVKTWEVTFIIDGDEKPVDVEIADNGKPVKEVKNIKARAGYELNWHYTDEKGERVDFIVGKTAVTKDLTVYGEWKEVKHVTYFNVYPNGGYAGEKLQRTYSDTENTDDLKRGKFTVLSFEDTGFTAPTGFEFLGWVELDKDPSSGSGSFNPGEQADRGVRAARDAKSAEEKASKEDSEKEPATETKPIQPGTELELKAEVYLAPVWGEKPVVIYRTNYRSVSAGRYMREAAASYYDVKLGEEFTVLSFEEAFNNEKEAPFGYRFAGWIVTYSDNADVINEFGDPFLPISVIDDHGSEVMKSPSPAAKASLDEKEEADPAAPPESGEVVPDAKAVILQPNDKYDVHLRVYLDAIWEPVAKVIYHRGTEKFLKEVKEDDALFEEEYTIDQIKEADSKFEVKTYDDTKLAHIEGYEFVDWTMEWQDPAPADEGVPVGPIPEIDDKEERAAEEIDRSDLIFKKEGKIEEISDLLPEESESVIIDSGAEPVSGGPVQTKPDNKEDLHAEVHLYANWKAIVYNAKWVDEDGTVLHGPVDFTVETGKPKDTDYNELSGKDDPTKKEDEKNTYEFSGWKEETDENGNVTYTAQYTPVPKKTADWVDEDGTALHGPEYFKNDTDKPKDNDYNKLSGKEDPTKKEDDKNIYEFSGWKEETDKDGNVVYTAQYTPVPKKTATWVDEDGETVLHGPEIFKDDTDKPKDTDYNKLSGKDDPTKKEDEKNTYEFSGWKEETDKDGNVVYTAQYTAIPKSAAHTATWVDEDGKTELNKKSFKEGEKAPEADSFKAPEKEGKVFDHWDVTMVKDSDGKETGDIIYTAVYKDIVKEAPPTGDESLIGLWIAISVMSMLGLAFIARKRRED